MRRALSFVCFTLLTPTLALATTGNCVTLTASLGLGSTGTQVSALQGFLYKEYQNFPNPTGYFGSLTEAALKQWQSTHGINTTGTVGPKTRAALACEGEVSPTTSTPAPLPASSTVPPSTSSGQVRTLSLGMSGPDVSALQRALIQEGLLSQDSATGFFGALTEAALKRYQAQNNIISSGTPLTTGYGAMGPRTRALIAQRTGSVIPQLLPPPSVSLQPPTTLGPLFPGGSGGGGAAPIVLREPRSCSLDGVGLKHGQSAVFFRYTNVQSPALCIADTRPRTCTDGIFEGDSIYAFATCSEVQPTPTNSCSLDGVTVANGASRVFYSARTLPFGATCTDKSGERKCINGLLSSPASHEYSSCTVSAPASCVVGGVTLEHGRSQVFYSVASVQAPQTCTAKAETRTCTNGALSGSASNTHAVCVQTDRPPQPALPCELDGITLEGGSSQTFYMSRSVPFGQQCSASAQVRSCTNGILSGLPAYQYSTCRTEAASSCLLDNITVRHGESATFYTANSVPFGSSCSSQVRTCTNGTFLGAATYRYASCSVGTPASCTLDGATVPHGSSQTFYSSQTVAYGSSCLPVSLSRTCANGIFSGATSFQYKSCAVSAPASCTFNGVTIVHGASVVAYQSASVASGLSCTSQQRVCADGVLSGTYTYASCVASDDAAAPTVAITAPAAGATVSGTTNITANASDNIAVAAVEFKLGNTVLSDDTSSPYSYTWNTTSVSNGSHTIHAVARDAAGNRATSTRSVTVSNVAIQPTLTITADPTTVRSGQSSTIVWSATNVTSCVVTKGSASFATGLTGSQSSGALTTNTIFTLTCQSTGGQKVANVSIVLSDSTRPTPWQTYYWSAANLSAARAGFNTDPLLIARRQALINIADNVLTRPILTVMDKTEIPPSGDKHDLLILARYAWPMGDPNDPNTPWLLRDGQTNPLHNTYGDQDTQAMMMGTVERLGRMYYFTGDERYAVRAIDHIRAWFINPATRVNVDVKYAAYIPGQAFGADVPGTGLIQWSNGMSDMLDAIALITASQAWTAADDAGMRAWLNSHFTWVTTSAEGKAACNLFNNHATICRAHVIHIALILGKTEIARQWAMAAQPFLINRIGNGGAQAEELKRTLPLHYSWFNIYHLMRIADLSKNVGVDVWDYQASGGGTIRKAINYIAPYTDPTKSFPGSGERSDSHEMIPMLAQYLSHKEDVTFRALFNAHWSLESTGDWIHLYPNVRVSSAEPTLSITASPTSVQSGQSSTITWSATNAASCAVTKGSAAFATGVSGSQSSGALSANTVFTLTCQKSAGGSMTSTQSVTVTNTTADTTLPAVSITAPSGTVSGTTNIIATASDNVGVVGVQFKVDAVNQGSEDTSSPYSISWDTASVSNGSHVVTAVARDAAGNTKTSSAVTVVVSNSTPPPPPPGDWVSSCDEVHTRYPQFPVARCEINFAAGGFRAKDPRVALVQTSRANAVMGGARLFSSSAVDIHLVANAAEISALGTLQPGEQVVLKNGVWKNQAIRVAAAGTFERPVLVRPESPGGVILTGSSNAVFTGSNIIIDDLKFFGIDAVSRPSGATALPATENFQVVSIGTKSVGPCTSCIVNRLVIDGYNTGAAASSTTIFFLSNDWGKHVTVANSTFRNKKNLGHYMSVYQDDATEIRTHILNNTFADRPAISGDTEGKGEFMQFGSEGVKKTYALIEGNIFENTAGRGANVAIKESDIIIRNNIFRTSPTAILVLRLGDRVLIEGNTFDGTGATTMGGVNVSGSGHMVINNTFKNLTNPSDNRNSIVIMSGQYDTTSLLMKGGSPFQFARAQNLLIAGNTFTGTQSQPIQLGYRFPGDTLNNRLPRNIYFLNNIYSSGQAAVSAIVFVPIQASYDTWNVVVDGTPIAGQSTLSITANPTSIQSGQSSTIAWSATNVASCAVTKGSVAFSTGVSGSQSSGALTAITVFTLTCQKSGGGSVTQSATVSIGTPPIVVEPTLSISANPTSIQSGQSSTIAWSTTNAASCAVTKGSAAFASGLNGSQSSGALSANTVFTLTCQKSGGGSATQSTTVNVTAPPVVVPLTGTWTDTRATFTKSGDTWTFVETTEEGAHYAWIRTTSGPKSSDMLRFSFLAKRLSGSPRDVTALMYNTDNTADGRGLARCILSGVGSVETVPGANSSGALGEIVSVGDGWYRCSITVKPDSLNGPNLTYWVRARNGSTESYTGDGTAGFMVKEMKVEILPSTVSLDMSNTYAYLASVLTAAESALRVLLARLSL